MGLNNLHNFDVNNFFLFFEKLAITYINTHYNIFITRQSLESLVINIFINDIKFMALKDTKIIIRVKIELTAVFKMVNIWLISFYLGLKVDKNWEK